MNVCFYNMNHAGDLYFSSLFIKLICNQNKDKNFYYYFIKGYVFFENIDNIKRISKIENNYLTTLINGNPLENLLKLLKNNGWIQKESKFLILKYRGIIY